MTREQHAARINRKNHPFHDAGRLLEITKVLEESDERVRHLGKRGVTADDRIWCEKILDNLH